VTSVVASAVQKVFDKESGLARGFTEQFAFDDGEALRGTPEVMAHAFERLKRGPYPLFYFMHLMDPHTPYYHHDKPVRRSHDAYMHEVAYVDEWIGRLRKTIRELGIADRTVLILTSDHGEGFGTHKAGGQRLFFHGQSLYDELLRVPMIVVGPGLAPAEVDQPVMLLDLAPTVLDLLKIDAPEDFRGHSLLAALVGETLTPRPAFAELLPYPNWPNGVKAMISEDVANKILYRITENVWELYDLATDPGEQKNQAQKDAAALEALKQKLNEWMESLS